MVQTRLIPLLCLLVVLSGCSRHNMSWSSYRMDGHRTGVKWLTADNAAEAMGSISDSMYVSPSGACFLPSSSAYKAAARMFAVQPEMAKLKQVIGWNENDLVRRVPECALTDYLVDRMMERTALEFGENVDVGILNFGGIRCDLPAGEILRDDIESMLPFNNRYCLVESPGVEVLRLFENMARNFPMIIGGARMVVRDRKIESLTIGGEPIDTSRTYNVATLDFLLDGGDNVSVARNARRLLVSDILPKQAIIECIEKLTAAGKSLVCGMDGRYVIEGEERQ